MVNNIWNSQNQTLLECIKMLRKEAGLTQIQLANFLEKPQSFVSKYESGERRLDYIELRRVVICCGSTMDFFANEFELRILSKDE